MGEFLDTGVVGVVVPGCGDGNPEVFGRDDAGEDEEK